MNCLTNYSIFLIYFSISVNAKGKKGSKGQSGSDNDQDVSIPLNSQYPTQILLFSAHNDDQLNGLIQLKEIALTEDVVKYFNDSDATNHFDKGTTKIHQIDLQLRHMPLGSYRIEVHERGNIVDGCGSVGSQIAVLGNRSSLFKVGNSSFTHSTTLSADGFQIAGKRSVIGKSLVLVNALTDRIECCGVIAYKHEHRTVTNVNPMIYAALTAVCVLLCVLTGCVCYTVDKSSGSEKKQTIDKGKKMEVYDNHDMDSDVNDRFTLDFRTKFNTDVFTQPPTLIERNFNTKF